MAPRKRVLRQAEDDGKAQGTQPPATARVTRSSARLAALPVDPVPEPPKKKKAVKRGNAKTGGEAENGAKAEAAVGLADPEGEEAAKVEIAEPMELLNSAEQKRKTVFIEHCKQCNSFKTRALQVKNGLENAVSSITVLVNPDKPRRGCFEIREEGGETFISLLEMKRPFPPLKALNMETVISDIIEKLNRG